MSFNLLVAVSLAYVALLFLVAFMADRAAARGRGRWLRSPLIYTLSLSVYCTAWTFYGAVGYAARAGIEFATIYLGPTLVFVGWWLFLRRLVRIGRAQRVTSIADLLSARYGKSQTLAALVTLLAVIGTTPYIALQLQSVTLAAAVFPGAGMDRGGAGTAFWVAAGLALFTILFGTRNLDANERHHGVVTAIALEAVVKLMALLAVGIFVVWQLWGGIGPTLEAIAEGPVARNLPQPGRWTVLILLSAVAVVTLPRMFQVLVVENADERHLATAAWAFPLYLLAMTIFVLPIAAAGLAWLPQGANPDLFVLTLPLERGAEALATLVFIGGFSSATSMVIVAAIALSTMISNHLVMPLWIRFRGTRGAALSGDVRRVVLVSRRLAIAAILGLGYLYYRLTGGTEALAKIGLISFAGVAQVAPALIGGLFWRGATRRGALAGVGVGFALWAWTLFLPSLESWILPARLVAEGPFGIGWLAPGALFGIGGGDPFLRALFWSLGLNALIFAGVSLVTFPSPLERLQALQFASAQTAPPRRFGASNERAESEELLVMAQRILGPEEAQELFGKAARRQGKSGYLPDPTPEFIDALERELAGSIGTAAAHAMIAQITGGAAISVEDLLAVADETAQVLEQRAELEAKSRELARVARELSEANRKLRALSAQKDAFLSQVSHELRTPMTAIRSLSELLTEAHELEPSEMRRLARIVNEESVRLTRLLDDLLDLSVLERGRVMLNLRRCNLREVIDRAVFAAREEGGVALEIRREPTAENLELVTDPDRLGQVFINLVSNARKYCRAEQPTLTIRVSASGSRVVVDFIDNGAGIPADKREIVFEKFSRLSDDRAAGSAGLGLAICREVMERLGGRIGYLPGQGGAAFRVELPRRPPGARPAGEGTRESEDAA